MSSTHVSDETEGDRFCLICGAFYKGKHSKCPHNKIEGCNVALANLLSAGLNEK